MDQGVNLTATNMEHFASAYVQNIYKPIGSFNDSIAGTGNLTTVAAENAYFAGMFWPYLNADYDGSIAGIAREQLETHYSSESFTSEKKLFNAWAETLYAENHPGDAPGLTSNPTNRVYFDRLTF